MPTLTSFWEKSEFFDKIDTVVLGSGIVGLQAALNLKRLDPALNIAVFEGGALPSGASTKNAGFACFGSVSELLDDFTKVPRKEVFELVERRFDGLQRLRATLGDAAIEYEEWGGFELFTAQEDFNSCAALIPELNDELQRRLGIKNVYQIVDERIAEFGFHGVRHLILNKAEGQINTGKMMRALVQKVRDAGIEIYNGIHVTGIHETDSSIELTTANGYLISVRQIIICTNGFAKQFLSDEDVHPARAQVLITKPLPALPFRGAFHYDAGYYYFRHIGNRILFGGGRNLDFRGETTTDHAVTTRIQEQLDHLLSTVIIPGIPYKVEMRWAGTMGVGATKRPIVKQVSKRIFCAVRMGGMGVALGSLTGEEVAQLVYAHGN
jgi:glycine/D-amino acid oxidase-like deaminating enzyme